MPEVETLTVFVKKENEYSLEVVYTLSNMKEVCQKPPHSSSHKCLRTLKEWIIQWPCKSQKGRVLTIRTVLGWSGGRFFSTYVFVFTYVLCINFIPSWVISFHDLKGESGTKVKNLVTHFQRTLYNCHVGISLQVLWTKFFVCHLCVYS